jgi:hypothetical protein
MSEASDNSDAQPPLHSETFWDVQAILAERHSAFQTGGEMLVVWKPSWIPIENVPEGPLLSSFREAQKARFQSSVGKLILPVEPDTALADDVAAAAAFTEMQIREHREHFQQKSSRKPKRKREREHGDGTPRKALGSVAKKQKKKQKTVSISQLR